MSVGRGRQAPGERWTGRDWLLAQALVAYEDSLCPSCGNPRHETMDPDHESDWTAPLPLRCHACTAIAHRAKEYAESDAPQALAFSAELKPRRKRRG